MPPKKFLYRGHSLEELQAMPTDAFLKLLNSRQRRCLIRGISPSQRRLMDKIKTAKKGGETKIKTHCRDAVILPSMVGLLLEVHNGKEFVRVTIEPEMIGHYLGEFALTRRRVRHGAPGMGATRSSLYIPLK